MNFDTNDLLEESEALYWDWLHSVADLCYREYHDAREDEVREMVARNEMRMYNRTTCGRWQFDWACSIENKVKSLAKSIVDLYRNDHDIGTVWRACEDAIAERYGDEKRSFFMYHEFVPLYSTGTWVFT